MTLLTVPVDVAVAAHGTAPPYAVAVDIDRFIAHNEGSWARLDELSRRGGRSVRGLSSAELDELVALYQRASAHLSMVRTQFDDVAVASRLSHSIGTARGVIYRRRGAPGSTVGRFFSETFPAAVWTCRRAIGVAAFLTLAPALALGFWLSSSGTARDVAVDADTQRLVAQQDFAGYYKSKPAGEWAFSLFTHNIEVAVLAFCGGALLAVGGVYLLLQNGANIGVAAAVMHSHGKGALFWGLILPHGLLEVSSILIASGAGLHIAWAIIAPGERTRAEAVSEEGLRAIVILLGTAVTFVVAGFTEAFVTPSGLPTAARIGVGVLLETVLLLWVIGLGRSAAARGATGRFGESRDQVGIDSAGSADSSASPTRGFSRLSMPPPGAGS